MRGIPEEPFSFGYYQDPYPTWGWMRENEPVYPIQFPGTNVRTWLISRHSDIRAVFSNSEVFSSSATAASAEFHEAKMALGAGTVWEGSVAFTDPPDHTRLRRLISAGFTPRRTARWADSIQQTIDRLLDAVPADEPVDLIESICYPLSITTTGEVIGADVSDLANLQALAGDAVHPDRETSLHAIETLVSYARGLVSARRADPAEDMLSALIKARDAGDALSEDELAGTVGVLLIAGYNTSANLIGNGVLALLDHPGQMALLRKEPALIDAAVEEILRYDGSAVTSLWRFAKRNFTIAGTEIPAGEPIMLLLGSANRDPAAFPEPDVFQITRADHSHMTFGHGSHFCLGAALGRLQGRIAISAIVNRFPDLKLAVPRETLRYRPALIDRALERLPLSLQ